MSAQSSARKPGKVASEPTTRRGGMQVPIRPWHLFLAATLAAVSVSVIAVRGASPVNLVFLALAVCAAGAAGFGLYRTVWPLIGPESELAAGALGTRGRAVLEHEKALALRAVKELEFDYAMGKVSESDFQELSERLRARATRLAQQFDTRRGSYGDLIERDVAVRRRTAARTQETSAETIAPRAGPADAPRPCGRCGTLNDPDAQYCKQCGNRLLFPALP